MRAENKSRRKFCTGAEGFNYETQSCCEKHDEAYAPGCFLPRAEADRYLLICVAQRGMPYRAILMFIVVRALGWIPWYWHRRGCK